MKYPLSINHSRISFNNDNNDKLSEISAYSALSNNALSMFGMKFP